MLLEILPFLPIGAGGVAVGSAAVWGMPKIVKNLPSKKEKRELLESQLLLQENDSYAEKLLVETDVYQNRPHTGMNWKPALGGYAEFPFAARFARGNTRESRERFEARFKDELGGKKNVGYAIRDAMYAVLIPLVRYFTLQQLAGYEQKLAKEVGKRLKKELLKVGLVLIDFHMEVDVSQNTKFFFDPHVAKSTPFKKILALAPQEEDMRQYLQDVIPDGETRRSRDALSASKRSLFARLDALENSWLEYELDHDLLLSYPLMTDASCEQTADFLRSMNEVRALKSVADDSEDFLSDFAAALREAEAAFVKAESNAKKMRHAHLTSAQRSTLEKTRPLISMYKDEQASPQERINAFNQASRRLEGIIVLPERPIMGILSS